MNNTLKKISKISNKNYYMIVFDYLKTKLINKSSLNDYYNLKLYNLTAKEKSTYLTYGLNNNLIKENNASFDYIYENHHVFEDKYHRFLNYNYLYLKDYLSFKTFIQDNPTIMINNSPVSVNNKNILSIYQKLVADKVKYITNYYKPCEDLTKLNNTGNSFIRFLTYHGEIVNAYLFIPLKSAIIFAPINLETGITDYPALDLAGASYDKSPETNEPIVWFKIPKWPRVKRYIQKVSLYYPEIKYETIDITITADTPILLNINNKPQYYYYQLPSHRSNNYGIINIIKKIRKEEQK